MNAPTRGVVAGGHPDTARAGAAVLRAGGNAADAAVAAVAASFCAEACLTGLGAGGFALVREPDGALEILDFFVTAPGLGRSAADLDARSHLEPYEVPFRSAVQVFNIGHASCATPGMPLGLVTLHERHGRLPLPEVLAPAIALAETGALLVEQQDYLHDILAGILTRTPVTCGVFAPAGAVLRSGRRLCFPGLADALTTLAEQGAAPFATGRHARRIADHFEENGGLITLEDLASYGVVLREPVTVDYRRRSVATNPPPSSGGTLIAHTLGLLDRAGSADLDDAGLAALLAESMEATDRARAGLTNTSGPPSTLGNTTHVSVIDEDGRAVSVTSSCGSGSGIVVPDTGFYMNNMMGEEDLNPDGFFSLPPGTRLSSMMSPTIAAPPAEGPDAAADLIAVGSAGSERLRSAIVQVLVGMIDLGLDAQAAVDRPRLHHHKGVIHLEGGTPEATAAALEAAGRTVNRWPVTDLFFGGAQVAVLKRDGPQVQFDGGGDPRRGGTAIIV